jgi:transcriptional regulator with XRE-family HTH domain
MKHVSAAQQLKAARALLGWSGGDLASKSGVSVMTVRRLESGSAGSPLVRKAIAAAFTEAGLEFIERGVKLR